jgi:hypothetical protein
MDARALALLELPAILERLADAAASEPGRARALGLVPSGDAHEVAARQRLTTEAVAVLDHAAEPELGRVQDVRPAIERPKKLTGKIAEEALGKAGITVNKNMIPWDPEKPMTTSGVRVGTPALTSRGMGAREMTLVASLIGRVLDAPADEAVLAKVRGEVRELCSHFPMYEDRQ